MIVPEDGQTREYLDWFATELLRQSLIGVTAHSEKNDILTAWKQDERLRREIYVPSGTPDHSRKGNFKRKLSHLNRMNAREGWERSRRCPRVLDEFEDYSPSFDMYDWFVTALFGHHPQRRGCTLHAFIKGTCNH